MGLALEDWAKRGEHAAAKREAHRQDARAALIAETAERTERYAATTAALAAAGSPLA
jgi:hypothetical protein